ncbi:MAG TPA: hypothetical protein VFS42_12760 [Burkholderiaceae bacterium]|nr:hypothetical protein [Burkholderiaceae bacterium]
MKRICAALVLALSSALAIAQAAVFVDMRQVEINVAVAHLSRLLGREISLAPGVKGRITITSTRAMTYSEIATAFERELKRNGLVAVMRGDALVVMSPRQAQSGAKVQGTPAKADLAPRSARYQPIVFASRQRSEAVVNRLRRVGIDATIETIDEYGTPGYAVVVEVGLDLASRRQFAERVASAGLDDLISLEPKRN